MGHHTEVRIIRANRLKENPSCGFVLSAAVEAWSDDPDCDRGSENAGDGYMTELMTPAQTDLYSHVHADKIKRDSVVIPLCAEEDVKTTVKKTKMVVPGNILREVQQFGSSFDLTLLAYKLFGPTVTKVKLVKAIKPKKAVAAATEGKTVVKYQIISLNSHFGANTPVVVSDGLESQAAARAEAILIVNSEEGKDRAYVNLEVRAYLVREDGNPALVTVSRPTPEGSEVEVEVTFSAPKSNAKVASYYVEFNYHN